ncbi:PH domain-containing protein [Candidatus Micrarchaeota archaeon]|nr:PH domain-containing protein [Candidatus Micrarchaeota archaeon]
MQKVIHPNPIIKSVKAIIIEALIIILLIAFRDFLKNMTIGLAVGSAAVLIAYLLVLQIKKKFESVILEEGGLRYKRGLLTQKEYFLPYNKITETRYSQNIVQRIFGSGRLVIDTPGGSDNPIDITEVSKADAQELITLINNKNIRKQ